jgi:hypothetical protein
MSRPSAEGVYQAWHGTDAPWGGCADAAAVERVLALFEPETVTTAAELDALPVGSVVMSTTVRAGRRAIGERISEAYDPDATWRIDSRHYYTLEAAHAVLDGSATVIYRPTERSAS